MADFSIASQVQPVKLPDPLQQYNQFARLRDLQAYADRDPLAAPRTQPLGAQPLGAQPLGAQPLGAQGPFDMNRAKAALAAIESGGRAQPYAVLGPVTDSGDRAHGKYQVMGANIPSWTREALGRSMTPAEFLANPEAQERVVETQLNKSYTRYGNVADAASVWFSGRPQSRAGNSSDGYVTVPAYVRKFMEKYNPSANALAPGGSNNELMTPYRR
jgi:hypothetical protein